MNWIKGKLFVWHGSSTIRSNSKNARTICNEIDTEGSHLMQLLEPAESRISQIDMESFEKIPETLMITMLHAKDSLIVYDLLIL